MISTQIRFIDKDRDKTKFFATLRQRVDAYFKENNIPKQGNKEMILKSVVFLSGYILPFIAMLVFHPSSSVSIFLWMTMGFCFAGIGMNVMHDANHGSYSQSHKINRRFGYTINLLGGSSFNWKVQHNLLHHTYTNIVSHDADIQDKMILRFSPHTEVKWYHRLQVLYALALYGLSTLYWSTVKDFVQFTKNKKEGFNTNTKEQNRSLMFKMIVDKLIYFFIFLVMPVWLFGLPAGQVIPGFLLMHFVAGVVLTVIFQLAHTVEGTIHPLPDENGTIENTWAIHQMNTTVNFSRNNKFISWYVGGLNFQIEHHLFPNICHVHYPEISDIVKTTAEEYGIPYLENATFADALVSHMNMLRRFGKLPDLNEVLA